MQNCVFNLETEASSRERIKTADSKNTNQYARYVVQVAFYNCETTRNRVLLKEFICILCYNLITKELGILKRFRLLASTLRQMIDRMHLMSVFAVCSTNGRMRINGNEMKNQKRFSLLKSFSGFYENSVAKFKFSFALCDTIRGFIAQWARIFW